MGQADDVSIMTSCYSWLRGVFGSRRARAERRVLGMLEHGDWVFGSDVIRLCQLGRGSGYALLDDMEERGLVESRMESAFGLQGRLPRRLYRKPASVYEGLEE
jgi:hypothetical protein